MEQFDKLLEAHFESAAKMYRRDPAIAFDPKVTVVTAGGEMIVVIFPGFDWGERKYEMLAEAASRLGREGVKIRAVFMATEAWLSQYPSDAVPEDRPRPSQDPDRQEIIMVTGASADGQQQGHIQAVIERDAKGMATLREPECREGIVQCKNYLLEHFLTVYAMAYSARSLVRVN